MASTVANDVLEQLAALGTATVHEAQGQTGAMISTIKPIDPSRRLAGPALTVDARPSDNLMIHHAITKARPGDVLVVDAKGFLEGGAWGDILTLAAQQAGIAGLVIDGSVRDAEAIVEMGFPVFCRGLSIKGTNKEQPGQVNEPIICGGISVNPGDLILGDRDGVVAVSPGRAKDVLAAAEAREAKEEKIRTELKAGKTTVEILGLEPTLNRLGIN